MTSTILAVLTDPRSARACLDASAAAATADPSCRIIALHVRVAPETVIMPTEEVMTAARRQRLEAAAAGRAHAVRAVFDQWCQEAAGPGERVAWDEVVGAVETEVVSHGKAADLTVLARPLEHEGQEALHAALFETGRLILHVPPMGSRRLGDHIAIAWKDCDQARAAVTAALPYLRHARRVSVLVVRSDGLPDRPETLLTSLRDNGISASPVLLRQGDDNIGAALLTQTSTIGADCLVMGAYRHGELIERLLGGVTRHVLQAAEIPVFLHH